MFIDTPPKNTSTYDVEYGETRDGIALPRKVTMSDKKFEYVFSDWKFDETPKSAFTTSHYGLSDLVEARKAQDVTDQKKRGFANLTWYLIGGATAATLSGLVFYSLANRKTRTESRTTP